MWFDNVVIILTWFILLFLQLRIYLKSKKVVGVVMIVLNIVAALIYFTRSVTKIDTNTVVQILSLLFMYVIPALFIYLYYNNIAVKQKIVCALGKFYYNMGRYDVAIKLYTHIIRTNKKNITSNNYYILGRSLRKEKRYSEARDMLVEAVELDKNNFMAYYELGLALSSSDKKDTAVIMFSNSLKIEPEFKDAKIALAITYSEIGRVKEAVAIYNELIEKDEADEEVLYNLANIYYYELSEKDEAEKCYAKAVEINSKLYPAWYNLGNINYLKGNYEASIKALNIARQSEVFKDKAEYSLAKCYIAIKESEKAVKLLSKLISKDDTYLERIKTEVIFEEIVDRVIKSEK